MKQLPTRICFTCCSTVPQPKGFTQLLWPCQHLHLFPGQLCPDKCSEKQGSWVSKLVLLAVLQTTVFTSSKLSSVQTTPPCFSLPLHTYKLTMYTPMESHKLGDIFLHFQKPMDSSMWARGAQLTAASCFVLPSTWKNIAYKNQSSISILQVSSVCMKTKKMADNAHASAWVISGEPSLPI